MIEIYLLKELINILSYQGNADQTTLRYHLSPVRMVKIKNTDSICWRGCEFRRTFFLASGMQTCIATLEVSIPISQKIGNQSTSRLSNIKLCS